MDDDTPPQPDEQLPGYGSGFKDGYAIGLERAVDCFRRALEEGGTDKANALLLAQRLRAWIATHGG